MKVYKLIHVPTGLFYGPVRGRGKLKTNLSKNGKIYQTKAIPNLRSLEASDKQIQEFGLNKIGVRHNIISVKPSDLKIVTFKLVKI